MDILAGRTTIDILDCSENGAGTCRNADYIEDLLARAEAAEAERDAARAEVARLRSFLDVTEASLRVTQDALVDRTDECNVLRRELKRLRNRE